MIRIEVKNKNYTGDVAGISFSKGVALVENITESLEVWFKEKGATVIKETKDKSLSKMNKAELTALAIEKGKDLPDGASNAEIIAILEGE